MSVRSGMFNGLQQAQASRRASYEKEGHYIQMIDRVKADETRKNELFVAIEKRIVAVVEGAHKPGEQVTHMLMKKHDSFFPNIKQFLIAILGLSEERHDAADFESDMIAICEEEGEHANPLGQTFIEVENKDVMTKNNKPFTTINYKREVPPSEIQELLEEGEIDKTVFFKKVISEEDFNRLLAAEQQGAS